MRPLLAALLLLLLASPATAWEFTPTPVCTLSHDTGTAQVTITFDPRLDEPYAITVTGPAPWPDAPSFSMRFDGPGELSISTTRQRLSGGGRTLTVTDTGFGNVLAGLEFNDTATAIAGGTAIPFPLEGAAEEVRAFRACIEGGVA